MPDYLSQHQLAIKRAVLVALILSILPFLLLTIFCNPAYDDYCLAAQAKELGFIAALKHTYITWSGKYFCTALLNLSPLTFGSFIGYKLFALLIILLTFVSIFCLIDAFFDTSLTRLVKIIAACFFTSLYSNQMPDITEGYYWMGATTSYQIGCILCALFFALVIKQFRKRKSGPVLSLLAGSILIVMIVGASEVVMVMFALTVLLITAMAFREKSDWRWGWLIFLFVTFVCVWIVVAAPGNAVRSSHFPNRHRLFYSLVMSLAQEARFLLTWFSNTAFALSTVLFIPIADRLAEKIGLLKQFTLHPLVSSAFLLVIVFMGFFMPYWATGLLGQHRTVNVAYYFFLIGWFINIFIWLRYLKQKRWLKVLRLPRYVYLIGVPLLLCGLLFSNNTKEAVSDLVTGRAYRYDLAVRNRRPQLEECARERRMWDCPIVKIDELPQSITNPYYELEFNCELRYWRSMQH